MASEPLSLSAKKRFLAFHNSELPGKLAHMESEFPGSPQDRPSSFAVPSVRVKDLNSQLPPKDWPHAPIHRLSDNGVYFITAGTLHKKNLFDTPQKRDLLERILFANTRRDGWQLEAWAVFSNHYHIVVRGRHDSRNLGETLHDIHGVSARDLNRLDHVAARKVWYNFRDTKLTLQHSYLARLNYVHQNAVKHKLVATANQYPWCSAAWFERVASPAQVKMIYGFKIDRVQVDDDF